MGFYATLQWLEHASLAQLGGADGEEVARGWSLRREKKVWRTPHVLAEMPVPEPAERRSAATDCSG